MHLGQSIVDKLAVNQPLLSVEFFPPKTEEGARQILKTAQAIQDIEPDFISITYGAGGSTRERTLEYGEILHDLFGFEVMPHLTCVGHSKDEIRQVLKRIQNRGFRNIMTLRGDAPKEHPEMTTGTDGLCHASDLVKFIREESPFFCLGVAGYPEKHPEAKSMEEDLQHLKYKVDQGASFITTQLFYNNEDYFNFVDACRERGITVPIIPGILPIVSFKQAQRFCTMCGAKIPPMLKACLEAAQDDDEAQEMIGVEWAHKQIAELLAEGVPGIHLYILNRAQSTLDLVHCLKQGRLFPKASTIATGTSQLV